MRSRSAWRESRVFFKRVPAKMIQIYSFENCFEIVVAETAVQPLLQQSRQLLAAVMATSF